MANFSLNVKINGVDQAVSSVGEVEAALRATKQELKEVEIGSQAFEELSNQARRLQDELKESFKEATNFDKNLGKLGESVGRLGSTVAASFSLITSTFQIFGSESQELSEAQVKAQQALAISFAATTLAMNAQKLAGDLKLVQDRLQLGLSNLLVAALGRETTAKAANAVATGTATVAQRALNAAMNANPIILLVTALAALTAGLFLFSSSTNEAAEETKSYEDTVKDLNDQLDRQERIQKEIISSRKELIRLQAVEDSIGKSEEERLRIKIQLQEDLNELEVESVEQSIQNTNNKLRNELLAADIGAQFALDRINDAAKLQDFNADKFISQEERKKAAIRQTYLDGGLTVNEYYKQLFLLQSQNKFADEDEIKRVQALFDQIDSLNIKLQVANKKKVVDDKLAEEEITKQQQANFKKRQAELEKFAKSQADVLKKLKETELKSLEDIEKFRLDAELKRVDDVNRRIEIISRFTEIELENENKKIIEIANAQIENVNKTIKSEKEKAKKIEEINQATFDALFQTQELAILRRNERITEEIDAEKKKVDEIKTIYEFLYEEITFGDQNVTNTLAQLAIRRNEIEIKQLTDSQNFERLKIANKIETAKEILRLEQQNLDAVRDAQIRQAKAERQQQLENTKQLYKDKFGEAFFETEKGLKILAKLEENLTEELNTKLLEIDADYRQKRLDLERGLLDEKLALIREFIDFATSTAQIALDLFSAISDLAKTQRENDLIDLRTSNNERLNILNEQYNTELELQQQQLERGLINQEQYNAAILALDTNRTQAQAGLEQSLRDAELKAKKKAFEDEKKLRIASTIISGVQGALQAFAGAFQLGPIAGPIVGGILAALVGATTGIQVAAIKKQKFDDSGSVKITPPNPSGAGPLGGQGGGTPGSAGGFTQFDESLLGPQPGAPGGDGGSQDPMRVYVLESDITNTQNRVNVAESNATFG
jgi:hypothetical protein